MLTYAKYAPLSQTSSSFKIALVIQILFLWEQVSFGICLVCEMLTYAEYAPLSQTSSSFKIALVIQILHNERGKVLFDQIAIRVTMKEARLFGPASCYFGYYFPEL